MGAFKTKPKVKIEITLGLTIPYPEITRIKEKTKSGIHLYPTAIVNTIKKARKLHLWRVFLQRAHRSLIRFSKLKGDGNASFSTILL
ncbi:hypothetical protein OCC_10755 [Thermococcus litoralis DSM 5473]|uniref:Uncharacterized protein n=1 Tax=Thermococcus litoralis (strain ATCC 51850 / DSM 5473 / JCM 8560 / NS-C) TaxID=523849 RepID=H3ZR01_THELN|nr:hypothetical protein OCC_10755 [Thermococcus litoralis DSM 5473]